MDTAQNALRDLAREKPEETTAPAAAEWLRNPITRPAETTQAELFADDIEWQGEDYEGDE